MSKIENQIIDEFLAELAKVEGFSKERVDSLRALFLAGKKPKSADIIKVLSEQPKAGLS